MPSLPFVAPGFLVLSATQLGPDRVRVTYSDSATSSALQLPATYALTGPSQNSVTGIQGVVGDPNSLDLLTTRPLDPGAWSLSVSGITGSPVSFAATALGSSDEGIAPGSRNDDAEKLIRKHLPLSLAGKAWNALIYALSIGDQYNFDNARLAFDQLFLSSASGIYLDRKASDNGIVRPPDLGMPDDLFRKLAIQTSTEKLTDEALLQILEIFYGVDSLRASAVTINVEPFALADGQDLQILVDERVVVPVVFSSLDFTLIQAAKAVEVAAAITRAFRAVGSAGFALPFADAAGAGNRVKIYSPSLGLSSTVRVTGGFAQSGLAFNDSVVAFTGTITSGDAYNWVVTTPIPGINRISLTTAGLLKVDLSNLHVGDYVVFSAANSTIPAEVYTVKNVGRSYSGANLTQYFDLASVTTPHSFLQLSNAEMAFFRPTKRTVYQSQRIVALSCPGLGTTIDLTIPATTQAVGRQLKSAAYLHSQTALAVSSLQRVGSTVTVTTSANHGLSMGSTIFVDGAFGTSNGPGLTAGSAGAGTSNASLATCWTATRAQNLTSARRETVVSLNDGRILVCGGDYQSAGTVLANSTQLFRIVSSAPLTDGSRQYSYNWITDSNMITGQTGGVGVVLPSDSVNGGKVLVVGGFASVLGGVYTSASNTVQIYTPNPLGGANIGTWAAATHLNSARGYHAVAPVLIAGTNKILAVAGTNSPVPGGNALASCEYYNPVTNTWTSGPNLSVARISHTATQLQDGRVLVVGGNDNGGSPKYHSSCEIFDGTSWTTTGRMTWTRSGHSATLLPDGRVLVVGGTGYSSSQTPTPVAIQEAEIYDPSNGRWRSAGRSPFARTGHAAVYLAAKGLVLITGGVSTPEYWDPKTFTFRAVPQSVAGSSACPSLATCVDFTSGTTLALATGASNNDSSVLASYLYGPGEDVFASGGVSGVFRVSNVLSLTKFQFTAPTSGMITNVGTATITAVAAQPSGSMVGPYILSPSSGVAVTAIENTTTMDLMAGQQYRTLTLADGSKFPDAPGWLCVGFGTSKQVDSIPYLGKLSANTLILDYRFKIPITNLIGAKVTWLPYRGPFSPESPESLGVFYVTSSAAGRLAAISAVQDAAAAGMDLAIAVKFPGDRGLGNAGSPTTGSGKLTDAIRVWGSDSIDADVAVAKEG